MKTSFLIFLAFLLASPCLYAGPAPKGIQFFSGSWQAALKTAEQSGKPVFVDFYATWCGPCKQMARDVFTDSAVGAYFNDHIISLQIDAEKDEQELVKKVELTAYPTLALFDASGNLLAKQEGALDASQLVDFIKSYSSFEQVVADFHQDPANLEKAMTYLRLQAFRDNTKLDSISTAILNQLPEDKLLTETAWNIFVNYSADYSSKAFAFVVQHARWYQDHEPTPGAFQEGYTWFTNKMLDNAAAAKDLALVEQAANNYMKVRAALGTKLRADQYYRESFEIRYLSLVEDSTYLLKIRDFVKKYHNNEWIPLAANALSLLESNSTDPAVLQAASRMALRALSLKNNAMTNFTVAAARQAEGNKQAAKDYSLLAMQKAKIDQLYAAPNGTIGLTLPEASETVLTIPLRIK